MATNKYDGSTTRREFLGTAAGVVGVATLPLFPGLPRQLGPAGSGWADVKVEQLATLRAGYLAEIERFAETLRPRFESGEMRACRDSDDNIRNWRECPQGKVEALAAAYFGVEVREYRDKEGGSWCEGDETTAFLIMAASPHGESVGDGYSHAGYAAADAASWDVIAIARERGWYTPTEDECADPLDDMAAMRAEVVS